MKLIILAAGMGTRLKPLTDDQPKVLTQLDGRTLLDYQLEAARNAGLNDIVVVGGYRAEQLAGFQVELLINEHYATTNMVQSLFCARQHFEDDFIMSYGDIVYGEAVLRSLLAAPGTVCVSVDTAWRSYWEERFEDPLSDAESLSISSNGLITNIGQAVEKIDDIQAQYIGLVRFKNGGVTQLCNLYDQACAGSLVGPGHRGTLDADSMYMTDLLQSIAQEHQSLSAVKIEGNWLEIDSMHDLKVAEKLVSQGRLH